MSIDYARGYAQAKTEIANFINTLDTESMTKKEIRSAVYRKCIQDDYQWGMGE